MKANNKKKGWCEDEDKLMVDLVQKYGIKNWAKIAEQLHLVYGYRKKTGKQCRQRWHNHLDPNIIKKNWTLQEEDIMFQQHKKHGNKWTVISQKLAGRTDNSIKNHFYSTIRRSLRRISKFMGSKNSTIKMRKIKPSTLSKIFSMGESKISQQSPNQQTKQFPIQQNCKEIAHYLLDFSRKKLTNKKYQMDQQDLKKFQKILQQMVKINDLYENQKLVQAKIRKQRYLQKNFDEAAESQSEDQNEISQSQSKIDQVNQYQNKNIIKTNNKKNIIQTPQVDKQHKKIQKNNRVSKGQNELQIVKQQQIVSMKIMLSPLRKIQQQNYLYSQDIASIASRYNEHIGTEGEGNKFDFMLQLNEDHIPELDPLNISPGIRNTPFALTPNNSLFIKQINPHHQPLKIEDCNTMINRIINDIRRNSNTQYGVVSKNKVFQSPSSAFKQCY